MVDIWDVGEVMTLTSILCHARGMFSQSFPIFCTASNERLGGGGGGGGGGEELETRLCQTQNHSEILLLLTYLLDPRHGHIRIRINQ